MATVHFTAHLSRHLDCPARAGKGASVREVLEDVFREQPTLRGYVLDDQSRLRPHVMIYIGDQMIVDRANLTDVVKEDAELYVMQALSGG